MTLKELEQKLKEATLDSHTAIQVASDLAINWLGKAHEKLDDLRAEVARAKIALKEENPKMSLTEIETRTETTDMFREYLRAKHQVERIEEFIKVAKHHSRIAGGF